MPKLTILSGRKVIQALNKLGFIPVRQSGSHVVLKKESAGGTIGYVVPLHKELAIGTLRGILRQAKVTPQVFLKVIQK